MGQNLSAVIQALVPKSWGGGVTKQIGNISADPNGSLTVSGQGGINSSLFITGPTIVKATPGMICAVVVIAAGAAGTINYCTATAAAVTANEVSTIPATIGVIKLEFPCLRGIVVTPGAG